MQEIKLYKSRWKAIRLMLLCSPFVTLGLYDIFSHAQITPIIIDWLCLGFFGLGIPLGVFNLFDPRPQIIINETGIFDRTAYKDFINWNLINDAYPVEVKTSRYARQKFICLVLDNDVLPLLKVNKKLSEFSKSLGFQEVNLSLGQVKEIDAQKFSEFIKAMSTADIPTKKELLINSQL